MLFSLIKYADIKTKKEKQRDTGETKLTFLDYFILFVFIFVEVSLIFYSISFAVLCHKNMNEQFVNVLFAAIMPIVYLFFKIIFATEQCKRIVFGPL